MRITEIINGNFSYSATTRAKCGKNKTTVNTVVFADGMSQARKLLSVMYGEKNVVSVTGVTENQLEEAFPNGTKLLRIPRILPTDFKHDFVQKALLNQMKRNALHVKPTIDDLRAAQSELDSEQKRVNLEYEDAVNDREKWTGIRKK